MPASPLLVFHIAGGAVGLLSGFLAVSLRKGSRWHRIAGNVFFVSMLCMSSAGAYMAFMKSQTSNIIGGLVTFYLVATAWITARRQAGKTGIFEFAGLLFALILGTGIITLGVEAARAPGRTQDEIPAAIYFVIGSVVLLAASGDIRVLVRGGISGTQRLVRHLWRMCFALFIASGSLFLARPHLFPMILRKTYVIALLGFLPLLLMAFWLIRVRVTKPSRGANVQPIPAPAMH